MEFLQNILYAIITAAVPVLTVYACKALQSLYDNNKNKIKNENVKETLNLVTDMIVAAVETTSNTYVKQLKAENLFDADAQKKAFDLTYETVKKQLTTESSAIIESAYGDVEAYLTSKIEQFVEELKK